MLKVIAVNIPGRTVIRSSTYFCMASICQLCRQICYKIDLFKYNIQGIKEGKLGLGFASLFKMFTCERFNKPYWNRLLLQGFPQV